MFALKNILPKFLLNAFHLILAWWGSILYRNPSEELFVIGVTGTSGKSSTIHFLRQILEYAGYRVGSLSTIDFYIAGREKLNDKKMTMLGRMQIQKYLRDMVSAGCQVAILETTSEGYLQRRHRFINYDTIILTNLYPEHIEAHRGFENYKAAKLGIFRYVANCRKKRSESGIGNKESGAVELIPKAAIVNGDSEYADEFLQFSFDREILFVLDGVTGDADGVSFSFEGKNFHAPVCGKHQARNIAAGIAAARTLGISWETIQEAVGRLATPPGRVEFIKEAEQFGFKAIVDYAFEPIAMSALYDAVASLHSKRIIHVFGSTGGGRDRARRFTVGKFIGERADICIVTDEDPYDDDPLGIMRDVAGAVAAAGKKMGDNLFIINDRREAIMRAIELAAPGDIVLVTGKGCEQGMAVRGTIQPWDDRVEVRKALRKICHSSSL